MRHSITSHLRPSPAVGIALAALLVASTGIASAKPQSSNDGVTVTNLSGAITTTGPYPGVPIPLNGSPSVSIPQAAGQALQLIVTVDADHPETTQFCGLTVLVFDSDDKLAARVDLHTEKGERGDGSGVGGLAAPATASTITLEAVAWENDDCDGADGADNWTVSLDVSVVGMSD